MIVKTVKRYWCEFCGKAGLSAGHMRKHELCCTRNPDRICGCCTNLLEQKQPKLSDITAMLPKPRWTVDKWNNRELLNESALKTALRVVEKHVRRAAEDCPVCIMAALKQQDIPPSLAEWFHYKEELAECWDDFNGRA